MKIIQYLFLLALLGFVAFAVHVTTQKNEFDIQQTYFINVPKTQVYNYLNDCRNWQTYSAWKQADPSQVFSFPGNTIGVSGYCAWEGSSESGKLLITQSKENTAIEQKLAINGKAAHCSWTLQDSLKGTQVTWHYQGSVSFGTKVAYALQGGVVQTISAAMQQTLANLNKTIRHELTTYSIKLQGVTKKKGCFYLRESINCKTAFVQKNIRILVPRMLRFFQKNKLHATGSPFVIYHAYDYPKGYCKISVCLPITDSIFTSPGSQITSGVLEPFTCYKTSLHGDYLHLQEARKKTRSYFEKNHISENIALPLVEEYSQSSTQIANPSKWVTNLYFPIKPVASSAVVVANDSTATQP